MIVRKTPFHLRRAAAVALAVGLALGASACDDGDAGDPGTTVVGDLDADPDVPFDPDVPGGVGTETDEGGNQGFDTESPGPVGNQTSPND